MSLSEREGEGDPCFYLSFQGGRLSPFHFSSTPLSLMWKECWEGGGRRGRRRKGLEGGREGPRSGGRGRGGSSLGGSVEE